MGNTNSCVRHLKEGLSFLMGGSSEDAPSSFSSHLPVHSHVMTTESGVGSVEQQIEQSRSHWSLLTESDSDFVDEEVAADNRAAFHTLQSHPIWGPFFRTFGYDTEIFLSSGELEVGEKFAEGGQAELFPAHVTWWNPKKNEEDLEHGRERVLKVFKKGTLLRHLQSQWPHGLLQFQAEELENWNCATPKTFDRYYCEVQCGTLLEDGKFAFLMKREQVDLRKLIDCNMMMTTRENCGPFSREDAEDIMWNVALGMGWLHSRSIVHRDLKASNVLVSTKYAGYSGCFVADYECSIGVVGTGFFRAPEILEACKDKSVSKRPELFTKSSDVYSYGMTCYEILTGKLPFDGYLGNDYGFVLNGSHPEIPKYVDDWIRALLSECWQFNPTARPSFGRILNLILANSIYVRKRVDRGIYCLDDLDWIKLEV